MLVVALRSVKFGLISLIPNIAPALMAFGVWGLMVGRVNIALSTVVAMTTACGSEGRVEFLSLGTAGTGGIYYPLGGAIASRLSIADSARKYTAEVSGGSVENVNRLGSGQMDSQTSR